MIKQLLNQLSGSVLSFVHREIHPPRACRSRVKNSNTDGCSKQEFKTLETNKRALPTVEQQNIELTRNCSVVAQLASTQCLLNSLILSLG